MVVWDTRLDEQKKLDNQEMQKAYYKLGKSIGVDIDNDYHAMKDEQINTAISRCLKFYHVSPGIVPEEELTLDERIGYLCRPSGTMYREVELEGDWFRKSYGAMLGQLESGEMVAIIPKGLKGYCYIDPSTDKAIKITGNNADKLKSPAWLFYIPFPNKSMNYKDLISYMVHCINKGDAAVLILCALAATIVGVIPAIIYWIAYGVVVPSGKAGLIYPLIAMLFGVSMSGLLFKLCKDFAFARISQKIKIWTEAASFSRMLLLPLNFFDDYTPSNLTARITQLPLMTEQLVTVVFGAGLSLILTLVYLLPVYYICASLSWVGLAILLIQLILIGIAIKITIPYERAAAIENAELMGLVNTELSAIQTIKLTGSEKRFYAKWAEKYSDYAKVKYNRPPLLRALPSIISFIGAMGMVVIYYVASKNQLQADSYMAFNVAYGLLTASTLEIATMANSFVQILPLMEMIMPILKEKPEIDEEKPFVTQSFGDIRIQNVWFRYDKEQPYLLKGLSLKIKNGEHVAIVGRSGCGKSTLMRLILGFETPEKGVINIGQYDTSKVDMNSLRTKMISAVLQTTSLFSGSVKTNITISSPGATVEDAWEAARLAVIDEEIRSWPMGMPTVVSEGKGYSTISGGQRQRILIARALCSKKSIMIMDEATSALDNETQRKVMESLNGLKCTRITIAHRLSTVKNCDRILVLDDGVIAEEGNYDQLIEKNGIFADLVERQRLG